MKKRILLLAFSLAVASCVGRSSDPITETDPTPDEGLADSGSLAGDASLPEELEPADATPESDVSDTAIETDADTSEPPKADTDSSDDATETKPEDETWGKTTKEPLVFAASDVSQETIDTTLKWIGVATDAWGQYGPLEIWIVGQDKDAVIALDELWCAHRQELDPAWNTQWDCANGDPYESGMGWSPFYSYINNGGAAVSVYRRADFEYHFQTITMSAKFPGPEEEDYRVVTMHEYFHVYQHGHIFDIATSPGDTGREEKMGGKDKPWFAEGSAEFLAQLLYSRQPEAAPGYLKQRMQWKYQSVPAYKEYGKRLDDLTYSDPVPTYDIATWFIAYLVYHEGEETLQTDFFNDLDSLGFEEAFQTHFGKTPKDYVDEFDAFLELGVEEALEIIEPE